MVYKTNKKCQLINLRRENHCGLGFEWHFLALKGPLVANCGICIFCNFSWSMVMWKGISLRCIMTHESVNRYANVVYMYANAYNV